MLDRVGSTLALSLVLLAAPASASGWHDYRLEVAPGFAIVQMNPFLVCLEGPEQLFIVCPGAERPTFGPIVEYAVTDDSIVTRNFGSKPYERNPAMWQGDSSRDFFFLVRRADQHVTGPLTREEWERSGLPSLSSFEWVEPRNPNFWTPLLGDLLFFGYMALDPPLLLLAVLAVAAFAWLRRIGRAREGRSGPGEHGSFRRAKLVFAWIAVGCGLGAVSVPFVFLYGVVWLLPCAPPLLLTFALWSPLARAFPVVERPAEMVAALTAAALVAAVYGGATTFGRVALPELAIPSAACWVFLVVPRLLVPSLGAGAFARAAD